MSQHTPGPWEVEDYRGPDTKDWRSTGLVWARTHGEFHPGTLICQVNCEKLHSESGDAILTFEANARLIAAAPELLEELINIVEAHRDGIPNYVDKYIDDYKALIAKATGGEK